MHFTLEPTFGRSSRSVKMKVVARVQDLSLEHGNRIMEFPDLLPSFKFNPKVANYGFLGQKLKRTLVHLENMVNSNQFHKIKVQEHLMYAKPNPIL